MGSKVTKFQQPKSTDLQIPDSKTQVALNKKYKGISQVPITQRVQSITSGRSAAGAPGEVDSSITRGHYRQFNQNKVKAIRLC